jgi:thioredoxin-dependent peroxiredoxin
VQLNEKRTDFESRQLNLVGISTDKITTLARFTERRGIKFTLLADKGGKIIDAFGQLNTRQGIALPAIYVVDAKGIIRAILREQSYQDRPAIKDILAAADRALKQ